MYQRSDFDHQVIHVRRTLVYVKCRDEGNPNYGKMINAFHEPKTDKGKRKIPITLRHTFATRCIERGMNPKTLQVIMGHSSVNITMNLYCHVTEDTLFTEMEKFEAGS